MVEFVWAFGVMAMWHPGVKTALAAGLAALAAIAAAQTEVERSYERQMANASPADVAWCQQMLPRSLVASRDVAVPPSRLRERFIGRVEAMSAEELARERGRLSDLLALALDGRPVTGGYSIEELAAQKTLIEEALAVAEGGRRIDPDRNSYRTYIDQHPDRATDYKMEMALCLARRSTLPAAAASTSSAPPPSRGSSATPRQAVLTTPSARRESFQAPASAGSRVPAATGEQDAACRERLQPDLFASYRDADQVYLDRQNYLAGVMRMDQASLAAERQSLSRRLDLMANAAYDQDFSRPNTIADLSGRYQLVIEAQEKLLLGDAIDVGLNRYNAFINAAGRQRAAIAQTIESAVVNCLTELVNRPIINVAAAPAPEGSAAAWMTGTFDTGGGVMQLSPAGGTYEYQGGRMYRITVNGAVMEGRWEQNLSAGRCDDGRYWGRFRLTFTVDGFSGLFGYCGEEPHLTGGFQGRRRR